ncbi:V-type ATPase 116kDa subunit family protein [Streptomyces tropicalis]|uniref:V-type ATPase 116kDa subunit family protein n=1 Tax=Streptomyces tropicalis TaxID=3034234 RepID=A0ABT6AA21_9ACTN|nr:V-type ATPase 116kDa subunit family protein [Streptomyces tropicalis]MDF3301502.1 V-type ATPase 116kDa subunit family protein [Streptomyces tropicalis]
MPWSEALLPVRMRRVAVVVPRVALRAALVRLADAGCVELDVAEGAAPGPAARRLQAAGGHPGPARLDPAGPVADAPGGDLGGALLKGEAELEERARGGVRQGDVTALAGWCPSAAVPGLAERLRGTGAVLVPLSRPRGVDPPTLLPGVRRPDRPAFTPLVSAYGTVPYADLDPSWPAGVVYVALFGIMFGDVGHGALLVLMGVLLWLRPPRRAEPVRRIWPFLLGAGACGIAAGFAYGEFFGPTGLLPVLWLNPLDDPERLLVAAVVLGAVLLACAHVAGAVNRWRERGPSGALYAATGGGGLAVHLGVASGVLALAVHRPGAAAAGAALAVVGLALTAAGFFATTRGGFAGGSETAVRLYDVVVRVATNTVSFARLAAFGLTHAALAALVWRGTLGLARHGGPGLAGAVVLFAAGTALTFALEALVAAVQALRLEYYELFSRLFESQGRPFRPWHVRPAHPAPRGAEPEVTACSPG